MRKLTMDELSRDSVQDFKSKEKTPIVLVLDNVRSAYNTGSVFRTADAFAVEAIHLCGITAVPPNKDIFKTALGATESVAWKHFDNTTDSISELKKNKFKIYAIEQVEGSSYLDTFKPAKGEKYALVFGHEVNGVSDEALKMIDGALEIPQFGTKHSFNIVVTVGIVLWDYYIKSKI
jgi:23S rRNA (guanosine2251-2'-O)-methyltransferase